MIHGMGISIAPSCKVVYRNRLFAPELMGLTDHSLGTRSLATGLLVVGCNQQMHRPRCNL